MKYTSIFEKLGCIFNLIISKPIYLIFIAIILLLTILLFINIIKKSKVIILILLSYITLFTIVIYNNYNALSKVFDDISTQLFTNIYFPSATVYIFMLLAIYITTLASIINIKTEKIYKTINGICFFIINFILVLIMELVAKNKIDIFNKTSLFKNTDLVMLLELSINIFIIWLISLTVAYITNKVAELITVRRENKELLPRKEEIITNDLIIENMDTDNKYQEEYLTNNTKEELSNPSPINIISEDNYNLDNLTINSIIKKQPIYNINPLNIETTNQQDTDILFNKLLNNGLPLIKEEKPNPVEPLKTTSEKENYTLNDYRIFNKILKDIKENNNGNIINIDKNLERRIITKYPIEEYNLFKVMLKNYSN